MLELKKTLSNYRLIAVYKNIEKLSVLLFMFIDLLIYFIYLLLVYFYILKSG